MMFGLILAGLITNGQGQQTDPVKVTTEAKVSGDTLAITVNFRVEENWMVYDSLGGEVGPIPISFNNDGISGAELISINKPDTKHKYDDIFEVDLWYFTKKASYTLLYKVSDLNIPATGSVALEIMSCNLTSGVCLPPKLVDIPAK